MLVRLFLIVIAYSCVECDLPFIPSSGYRNTQNTQYQSQSQSSGSQNQGYGSQNTNYGSQNPNYGQRISDSTYANIRQNLVPVALISSAATPATYTRLEISIEKNGQLLTRNDGYLITSVPANEEEIIATLTGGPVGSRLYNYGLLAQNNDQYPNNTRVSTTSDGVGFPVQFQMFFWYSIYGSLLNALNFEDGLILIIFDVLVEGIKPNPLFEPFRSVLTQVVNPNSTALISAYNAFEWLLSTLGTGYYVHPSSYIDLPSGREIPCATNIQPNFDKHPWLSYTQFTAYENLLNRNYQPLANPLPLYPLAGRRFEQSFGPFGYSYQ